MPVASLKACKVCGAKSDRYYCPAHRPNRDQYRGGSYERGYDQDWRLFRKWYLQRHPLCVDCTAEGKYVPARDLHHIVKVKDDASLRLVESNIMGLCTPHHSIRTRRGE